LKNKKGIAINQIMYYNPNATNLHLEGL